MAWNGTGTFSRIHNWVNDRDAAINIDAPRMDAEQDSMATGINACLAKNGENTATGNLPMGNNRHTGVADGAALTDYPSVNQIVDGALTYGGASSAGTDTYAVNLTINPGAYGAGQRYQFIADVANTGACTINFNGNGAKSIKLIDGSDPFAGEIAASSLVDVYYTGTNFILLSAQSSQSRRLIETITASSSVTVEFTTNITSTYTEYLVRLENVVPATNNATLRSRLSVDAGSNWKQGAADYRNLSTDYAYLILSAIGLSNTASDGGMNGNISYYSMANAAVVTHTNTEVSYDTGTGTRGTTEGARYNSAAAMNGIQFYMSSGNIASGVFKLYGVL